MKPLIAFFSGLLAAVGMKAAQPAPPKAPAEMMPEMRLAWLSRQPAQGTYTSDNEVVAVVMDWPLNDTVVSVLSSSAGDASLYTTSTFGIIGGIGHENVRKVAISFVACARQYLDQAKLTTEFPYPDSKTLRFYLVTPKGVRVVSFPLSETERTDSPAAVFFGFGQQVVTELRLITTSQKTATR
jgi:hypothetical protein